MGKFDVILFALQAGCLSAELRLEQLVSDVFLCGPRDDLTLLALLDQLVDIGASCLVSLSLVPERLRVLHLFLLFAGHGGLCLALGSLLFFSLLALIIGVHCVLVSELSFLICLLAGLLLVDSGLPVITVTHFYSV